METRVTAIIIKDKKILLVTDKKGPLFWLPGGKKENMENDIQTLSRELDEELSLKLKKAEFYCSFKTNNQEWICENKFGPFGPYSENCYLVDCEGQMKPGSEIKGYAWVSSTGINDITVLNSVKENLFRKLVKEGLL